MSAKKKFLGLSQAFWDGFVDGLTLYPLGHWLYGGVTMTCRQLIRRLKRGEKWKVKE